MSKSMLFGVGLGLGLAIGGVAVAVVPRWKELSPTRTPAPPPLTLDVDDNPLWQEINPGSKLHVLRWHGQDVAGIQIDDKRVLGILILDVAGQRQLSISASDDRLLGSIHFNRMAADNPYQSLETLCDDDADGIPDKRVEWSSSPPHRGAIFEREAIMWTRKHPATSSTAPDPAK